MIEEVSIPYRDDKNKKAEKKQAQKED